MVLFVCKFELINTAQPIKQFRQASFLIYWYLNESKHVLVTDGASLQSLPLRLLL